MIDKNSRSLGRPRKEHGATSTKDKILQIATAIFLEKGYNSVSMDDVAERCNVTKATIYYYYKTKADLFTGAMLELMKLIHKKSVAILNTDEPLKTQLYKYAKAHFQATIDIDINVFMREAKISLSEEQLIEMKKSEEALYNELENAISNAMNRGEIRKSNARLTALLYVNLLTLKNSIYEDNKLSFDSVDSMAKELVDMYWNGQSK